MNQTTLYGITGRTELGLNEHATITPQAGDQDPCIEFHLTRAFFIAEQEGSPYWLTDPFQSEAWEQCFTDLALEPNHEPEQLLVPAHYTPVDQVAFVSETTYCRTDTPLFAYTWTLVTTFDVSDQPLLFSTLPIGTVFYDSFAQDMVQKTSALRGVVVASDELGYVGQRYGYVERLSPLTNTVYPALDHAAQHLAQPVNLGEAPDLGEWTAEPLATDPPLTSPSSKLTQGMLREAFPKAFDTPGPALRAQHLDSALGEQPIDNPPQAIPVTYKVPMGNCYRLFHHDRQIAICPSYGQAEVIAQALVAMFDASVSDFRMTLDYIEGFTA